MTPIAFRALAGDGQAERWVPEALPWVHEAGNPYYDWFFEGRERTLAVLGDWMRRPSSEVFVGRAVMLVEGHQRTGGFIALGGDELRQCRRADALAAMETAGRQGRGTLLARMRQTQELFGPVPADAFYLSKMGRRGRGAWGGSWPADPAGVPVRRHGPEIPAVLPRHVRRQHLGGPSLPRRWISGQPQRRQRRGHAWQDSKDDRADGGRTALGSQRQDAR